MFVEPEHRAMLHGRAAYNPQGYGSELTPEEIEREARREKAYQDSRNAWAAAHPDVALSPWTPRVRGREATLLDLFRNEQLQSQVHI
jgi:hypothetical protein